MTLSITATSSVAGTAPAVLLTVSGTLTGPNVIPNNTAIVVTRIHADGTRNRVLTAADPRIVTTSWTWLDLHAPYNQAVSYEVVAAGFTATSSLVTRLSSKAWLLSPASNALAFQIDAIKEIGERGQASRSGKFIPIGAAPIFLSDGFRETIKGSVTLRVPVATEASLRTLLADDNMILINTPGTLGWDLAWMWVQPNSVSYSNPANLVTYPYRTVDIEFESGAQPDLDLQPAWTSGTAATAFAGTATTSGGVVALYATSEAFVTNTRL